MALKRNIIANYFGQGWSAVMGLAFIPLYIRYLGMESYGLIGLFAVMQAWLTLLDMGMTPTLNREMARFTAGAHSPQSINNLLRSLEIITICIAAVIVISTWIASSYLATDWLKAEKLPISVVGQALAVMGIVVALRFIESIYRSSLIGLQKQVWYNVVNAAIATLRNVGAVVVLAWLSPTVQAFFLWQAAISMVSVVTLAAGVHRALPEPPFAPKFTFVAIADVWKFASGMMLVTFLAILLTQIDKVLLSRLLPLELFGYYTLASTVAGVLYIVISPITTAFYPRMVELSTKDDQAALAALYHQGSQLVTVLIVPALMLLCFFSKDVLFMWSGDVNLAEKTGSILSIFVVGVFLNCLMHMPVQLQLAYGWVSLGIKTNIVAVVVLVPAIFWTVPRYGVIGAAWIWVILNAGYVLIAVQIMHRRIFTREKWRWYFADVLLPTIGAAGIMLLAKQFRPEMMLDRWTEFFFLVIAGAVSLATTILLADKMRPMLLNFAKYKLARF
ncbi:lipopolysaccharide biosynthesis protein [Sideroxydans lithotrophicus]|uniref:Polysaccharide biosynthesis protein n=1 Tax=Sideroxydans lithotrophicus (strain ES-1) TaxID=580332 RepID=D5CQ96_SIDLE|nr:oligosaccharide flippase family protein [Sideroxydans lithotrophicus]ADE13117.1 polysaccharide biosynthesis protein [Sideroxydans lithotrophicus ES-1]